MTEQRPVRERLRELAARHVDVIECGFPLHEAGTTERPPWDGVCGYARRDAVHDLYPDVSKRDRLPTHMTERNRHAFVPGRSAGICEHCRDDWPCDATKFWAELDTLERRVRAAEEKADELREFLALRPNGHTGMFREIALFIHCGISHHAGAECVVCRSLISGTKEPTDG